MQATRLFRRNNPKWPELFWRPFKPNGTGCCSRLMGNKEDCCCEPDPCCGNDAENSASDETVKVTVIGAAGRVGRTLSLLLKTCPLVDQLCMFDIDRSVKGFCVDISHVDTKCCVNYVCGMRNIQEALDDPDVVLIAAGSPSSPNLNGRKLFRKNAPIVAGLSEACARFCPEACVVLITNPINSLLPVAGEVYELVTGEKPSQKLFGLTTLDVVRANTFVAEATRRDPSKVIVPVIGGTSEETIVPVISQMKPACKIKHGEVMALTECVKQAEGSLADCQNCGTRGSSSLSTAYAAFRFSSSLISALKGEKNIVECAYVQSEILPELEYLASPLRLGINGIEYNYGYPKLSEFEVRLMENAASNLRWDIEVGKLYVCENRNRIMKSLRDDFTSRFAQAAEVRREEVAPVRLHDVVEVNEPAEAVSFQKKLFRDTKRGGPARSAPSPLGRSDVRKGYSAVFPTIMKRVIKGSGGESHWPDHCDGLFNPRIRASAVVHEFDDGFRIVNMAYPLIMYITCFVLMYLFMSF